jgi:hypothetical protein
MPATLVEVGIADKKRSRGWECPRQARAAQARQYDVASHWTVTVIIGCNLAGKLCTLYKQSLESTPTEMEFLKEYLVDVSGHILASS